MFKSATFKLTAYYLAMVMFISLIFSVALYYVATNEVRHGLQMETKRITSQFPVFEDAPGLLQPTADADYAAKRILWRLATVNVVVLVGAGYASYFLARRTLQPIEESLAQQARFTSDVSHELRTPLTAVRMESEVALLDKNTPAKDLRNTLKSNVEEVGKMETLINNLLRLTKLDSTQLQQSFESVSLNETIQTAINQTERQATARNITLDYKLPPKSLIIHADSDSISQLFIILIENAIKYSTNGSRVTIRTSTLKDHANVTIADKGVGIEKEALEHVFDRFYRADSSRNKLGSDGYGLGLSIAKMIADIHNAEITLSSQPGKGTTATVKF